MTHEEERQPNRFVKLWQAMRSPLVRSLPFLLTLIIALIAFSIYDRATTAPAPLTSDEVGLIVAEAMASATPPPNFGSQVYRQIFPSLVYIQTERSNTTPEERFGLGSGVIFNQNGEVLTSLHVVEGAAAIQLIFFDGTEANAEIVSADPSLDIAVLRPDGFPQAVVPATLGNPDMMNIGDETYAVGNPLGLVFSMSEGVISGFDRVLTPAETDIPLEGLIQFDAAVNRGSSGGPLLNRSGHVIGIVTALANPVDEEFFIGIGFAVPINAAVSSSGAQPSY